MITRVAARLLPLLLVAAAVLLARFGDARAVGPNAVRTGPGLDANVLIATDDGSTAAVPLGFTVNFFGASYSQLYVNANGSVTFDGPLSTFSPFDLAGTGRVLIAPFFADVDTRAGSAITYGSGTVDGRPVLAVSWVGVRHYSAFGPNAGQPTNSFQLVLFNRSDAGPGDFDIELNYDQIAWESGQAGGGDAFGLGGRVAHVGFSNGSRAPGSFFELAGSGLAGALLDSNGATGLVHNSRASAQLGRYVFRVRGGALSQNDPPTVLAGPDVVIEEGRTFAAAGTIGDSDSASWTATVNFGDGSGVQPVEVVGTTFDLSHVYADNGAYVVTVVVTDDGGLTASDTVQVTVSNVAPTAALINNGPVNDDAPVVVTFVDQLDPSSTDVAAGFHYAFACDDGSLASATYASAGPSPSSTCVFTAAGGYPVRGRIIDKDGGFGEYQTIVTVLHPNPTVSGGSDVTIDEGGAVSRSGSFSGAGAESWTATVDYGDGSGVQPLPLTNATFQLSHTYAENGAYTITIRVIDNEGGEGIDTIGVTVNNLAPAVEAGPNVTLVSSQSLSLIASFADSGVLDTHTSTVNWGDGSPTQNVPVSETQGAGTVTAAHAYTVPGGYTLTVCVKDDEAASGCDSLTVTVSALQVRVDIKPGSQPNSINLGSRGNVPVGIFGGTYGGMILDVTSIVRSSLIFAGAPALGIGGSPENLDADGVRDVVYHFDTRAVQLTPTSTQACVSGRTTANLYFVGCDSVQVAP